MFSRHSIAIMHNVDLVLYMAVNGGRIYAMSECKMYCEKKKLKKIGKKYLLCTNVRVELSGDKFQAKGLNVRVFNYLRD